MTTSEQVRDNRRTRNSVFSETEKTEMESRLVGCLCGNVLTKAEIQQKLGILEGTVDFHLMNSVMYDLGYNERKREEGRLRVAIEKIGTDRGVFYLYHYYLQEDEKELVEEGCLSSGATEYRSLGKRYSAVLGRDALKGTLTF